MATNKYFKCPYCDNKYEKDKLISHLENKHLQELPEGFSPLRVVFHVVNRKDFNYARKCRVCKKYTNWDENKARYNFLCGSERCHDEYVKIMRESMGDKLGINRQTKTAEGLKKMLANRRISGKYKFTDGSEVAYTGSYEKKALEFFDNVLNIKSDDLMIPGPTLSYELDGKKHIYIPDMYYIPYNLIIEIKDGGNRPNQNPQWKETRLKQMAKEKYIVENTDFNYIRLTNNDFSQILAVFADLKMSLKEYNSERVIHVNETVSSLSGDIPPVSENDLIIVNYLQNNVFANDTKLAIIDKESDRLFIRDDFDSILKKVDTSFLENCKYSVYLIKDKKKEILENFEANVDAEVDENFIYRSIFNHDKLSEDQFIRESNLIKL